MMHKPSPSRLSSLLAIAASLGIHKSITEMSTAEIMREHRGKAPKGMRWRYPGVYIPGGDRCNVEPTRVRNPKVAANVQMMHEKWLAAHNERQARHA